MSDIVESGYDNIAEEYDKRRRSWSNKKELEDFARRLPRGGVVLDAGCGAGYVARFLSSRGFTVTGIDVSAKMLELAKHKAPKATFEKMDMRKMEFPPETFDGVVSLYSIIHVPRRSHRRILTRFRKLLKPNGFLLLATGWSDYVGTEANWLGAGTKMFWSHFGKETNLATIKQVGFQVIWSEALTHDGTHLFVLAKKS